MEKKNKPGAEGVVPGFKCYSYVLGIIVAQLQVDWEIWEECRRMESLGSCRRVILVEEGEKEDLEVNGVHKFLNYGNYNMKKRCRNRKNPSSHEHLKLLLLMHVI